MNLTPGRFEPQSQQWQPIEAHSGVPLHPTRLTVATMNVWFGEYYLEERCGATLALLEACGADVITLQEVTPFFLKRVRESPWVQAGYTLSDTSGSSIDPYGVLILSRLPMIDWQLVALPSAMGRDLVLARADLQAPTTFASLHLESHAYNASLRAEQLAQVFPRLAPDPRVILTGDFNLDPSWEENKDLDPSYQDVWSVLRPSEPGYTEDTDVNTMRLLQTGKQKQVRFDRILLRSQQPGWRAESIQLIGTEPISAGMPNVFPSDHFGLISSFTWQ